MTGKEISGLQAEPVRSEADSGEIAVSVTAAGLGALVSFPFDVATVERFKVASPRSRWREEREQAALTAFEDERGRDAFSFEPIDSPYLGRAAAFRQSPGC